MDNNKDSLDFETILASSVHDMKNSLAMLLGSLEEITNQCSPESCSSHKSLLRIQHEGQRVNNDLIKLLTLYRIDRSQYTVNASEVCVNDLLDEITFEYERLLDGYNIKLEIICEPELYGIFDRELVSGVIKTIISNAYQYTKDTVHVCGELINDQIVLSIIDNGSGYPQHMLHDEKIPAGSVDFGTGSTGLGLYFSYRVAALHKNRDRCGFIQISNDGINNGGCFRIHLP